MQKGTTTRLPSPPDVRGSLAAFGLGVSAVATQTVLLRETLSVFAGNELVIGIVLANWMILTGAGALVGRRAGRSARPDRLLAMFLWALALLPLATIVALHGLRNVVFPVGALIGLLETAAGSFILLLPYSFIAGFLFTLCVRVVDESGIQHAPARVYALEAAGSVAGGLAFNLLLLYVLSAYQTLLLLTALNSGIAHAVSREIVGPPIRRLLVAAVPLALIVLGLADLDGLARRLLFPGQKILFYRDTPYGNLTVTRQGYQENFFENSVLLFSTGDVVFNEEAAHYAMIQHPRPRTVLLIGGGISGTTTEILKHGVERIDYVEVNPWIIRIGRYFTASFDDPRVHPVSADARRFIRETEERYDAVLINVPEPTTAQLNRLFTLEFLQDIKAKLNDNGIVSCGLLAQVDYYGEEARRMASVLSTTLRQVFQHVLIVPGFRNTFVASDRTLDIHIARLMAERHISAIYVNGYYLDDALLARRSKEMENTLLAGMPVNTDFRPVAYYRQLLYWLAYFELSPWIPIIAGLAVLAVIAARLNVVTFGIVIAGFNGSAVEVLLLVAFQVLYGYVYHLTGLIITMFMAGLAAGAFLQARMWKRGIISFVRIQSLSGAFCLILPAMFLGLRLVVVPAFATHGVFFAAAFAAAFLVGSQFALAASLLRTGAVSAASDLYGLDLLGSAIGAIAVSVVLIPLLGILEVCVVLGVLSLLAAAVSSLGRKKYLGSGC